MKKASDNVNKQLSAVKLFREDVDQMMDILEQDGARRIELVYGEYEFEDIAELVGHVERNSSAIMSDIMDLTTLNQVGEVRMKGLMIGIELVQDKRLKTPFPWEARMGVRVCERARELGMIIRPLGNVVVFMPPLASPKTDLETMIKILRRAIIDVTG